MKKMRGRPLEKAFPRSTPRLLEGEIVKPFLKWAGNKYRLVQRIAKVLPKGKRLIEPFVGSGAVFLNVQYPKYLLADSNKDLIRLFNEVKNDPEGYIKDCRKLFVPETNKEDVYYRFREEFNTTRSERRKALLFLYLNRHTFNGLCRYNRSGEFNSPFGRYANPYFPETEILHFALAAKKAEFIHSDFRAVMKSAREGDVVYCDPPYDPLTKTASFTSYSAGGFGQSEQLELAELAEELSEKGVTVVVSNHSTEFVHKAYRAANVQHFDVQRFISANGQNRGMAREVLAVFAGT